MWDLAWLESLSTWKHNNLKFKNLKLEKLKLELRSESAAWWGLEPQGSSVPQVGAPGWCSQVVARAGRPAGSKRLQVADERSLFLCSWLRHRRQPLGKRQLPGCPPGWRQSFLLIPSMMRNRICFWSPCQSLLRTNHLKLDWLISFSSHQRSGWGCCSLFFVGWRFFLFLYPFCGRQLGQKELASGAPCFRQGVSAPSNLELVREGFLLRCDWLFWNAPEGI